MNPYQVIQSQRVTEKTRMLENLQHAKSNRSVSRCLWPKLVFNVDIRANKVEIARAIEAIYADKQIKVVRVNTMITKPKWRRVRGFWGKTARTKKAIVTLRRGDLLQTQV